MKTFQVAAPYARALFRLAGKEKQVERIYKDLTAVSAALIKHKRIQQIMSHPVLDHLKKSNLVDDVFGKSCHVLTLHFLKHLIRKSRLEELDGIVLQYHHLYNQHNKILEAKISSAWPLTKEVENKIKAKLEKQTGCSIELDTKTDSSLIGGVVIRVENKIYDFSVKGQIQELEETLSC